ncbi:MAG: hypothetical protein ISR76_06300 [Planctomycetes bacterium]|nr:hypothetical protein [Planctomycetota bacterium]MBL7008591.1 hypothetical protein [Planctomycetota bacterium]
MKLYDEYADLRDRFEILAFHDATVGSFEELDRKLAPVIERRWKRTLPFPILLDATGATVKRLGIRSFPTHVLVDPAGKVVRGGDKLLEQKLRQARASGTD